jgi:phosphate transport system permease protein
MNINPAEAAAAYRERVIGPMRGLLPEAALRSMEEQLSGSCTVEIAAFDEFSGLIGNPDAASPEVVQRINPQASGFNILAACIGVGILSIPLVASVSEDAMRAVPRSLREASYGLGARRLTTSMRVVFPAAISGIVAALILATSRAIGETMVVALAAGASGSGARSWDIFNVGQTLTAAMASLAIGSDRVRGDDLAFPSLFFVGAVLFVITLLLNIIGDAFVRRTRQQY